MHLFFILLFHQQHTKVRKATPYWCSVFQYRPNLSFITRNADFKRLLRSIYTFVSCLPSLQCSQHEGSTLDLMLDSQQFPLPHSAHCIGLDKPSDIVSFCLLVLKSTGSNTVPLGTGVGHDLIDDSVPTSLTC